MLHGSGTPWCSRRATAFPASLVSLCGCRVLHCPLGLHHPLHVATALTSPASVPLVHRTAALGLLSSFSPVALCWDHSFSQPATSKLCSVPCAVLLSLVTETEDSGPEFETQFCHILALWYLPRQVAVSFMGDTGVMLISCLFFHVSQWGLLLQWTPPKTEGFSSFFPPVTFATPCVPSLYPFPFCRTVRLYNHPIK